MYGSSDTTENELMALNARQREQFNRICDLIARGKSLRKAAKATARKFPDGIRTEGGFRHWVRSQDVEGKLATQYACAREDQADYLADEIVDLADDEKIPADSRRIRVDARKWVASKLRPKQYGDKLALGGADDLPAIRQEVQEKADAFVASIEAMADKAKTRR